MTNNFAVWAYQNNEMCAARASFLELGRMVLCWPGDPDHAAGFQSNLALLPFFLDEEESDDSEYED